ncbi:oligosaccharide flippase family protein [uncultured Marixanthomonas sp.]|uniref:lipopolysaccharide biosynthesis protein n=1 Tax=uncultured Marixanthomonas sp. TaxID=757245 RepID=UPI0030D8642F|tara:strand:+ start:50726 stop:51937 length:1212 start_codon:yes stop_codon:yes gene_type:complete
MIQLKNLAKKHSSFLVIVIGAFAVFAANILLKNILSPKAYGEYSILITFFQVISSFGLLGFEQVFLRISEVKKQGVIQTDKTLCGLLFFVWLLFGIVGSYFFQTTFSDINLPYAYFLFATISITLSMFLFNVYRLNTNFTTSQLFLNSWKILLFILCIIFLWKHINNIELFVKILTYSLIGVFIFQIFYTFKTISFNFLNKQSPLKLYLFGFHFFISLLTITFIGYSDRFIVKSQFGAELLGEYFFLATLFLFPYSLIQGYVGFKELVAFKKEGSLKQLNKKLTQINILGLILGVLIILGAILVNKIGVLPYININDNVYLIIIFLATGIVKLNYSLFSALFGARADIKTIKNANLQSLIFIAIIGALFYRMFTSIELVALAFLLFWISRTGIFIYNLKKQFK